MRINQQQQNNVNFTAFVPTKIFLDGKPVEYVGQVNGVINVLKKELHSSRSNIVKEQFALYDGKYHTKVKKKLELKSIIDGNGHTYLATGDHAQTLENLGARIGIEKNKELQITEEKVPMGTLYRNAVDNFYKTFNDFLCNDKIRPRTVPLNKETKVYEGPLADLVIKAKHVFTRTGFKIVIEEVCYEQHNVISTTRIKPVGKKVENLPQASKVKSQQVRIQKVQKTQKPQKLQKPQESQKPQDPQLKLF